MVIAFTSSLNNAEKRASKPPRGSGCIGRTESSSRGRLKFVLGGNFLEIIEGANIINYQ
jgi:hypothetical protein